MNMKDLIYNERTGEFVPVDNTNNKSHRHLIYDERIGEFVPVNLINNKSQRRQSVQVSSINNIKLSTYYYIDGISHPYKGSEIVTMQLPKGTRVRKMLDDKWIILK